MQQRRPLHGLLYFSSSSTACPATDLEVHDALDDALQRAELGVEAQREEHEEEEERPEVAPRELVHSLGEQDESQAGAGGRLKTKE